MPDRQIWNQIKETLQHEFNQGILHSVLEACTMESFIQEGKKHFQLQVPSSFHENILKGHLNYIQAQLVPYGGELSSQISIKKPKEGSQGFLKIKPVVPKAQNPVALYKNPRPSSFSSEWSFSSFIEGPNNCFALSLARSIANQPCKNQSNPLFIHGPSGLGKTHLLQAIGGHIEKHSKNLKVRYLPAERFFNDCISHIRKNEMPLFRQKYRENIQVLLLDDIQIIGKGAAIQEEFFHTFESLKQAGCQIVLASDQKPSSIKGLKTRIKTRFEGGVLADIGAPDKDTKMAIIKNKLDKLKLPLSKEILARITEIPTSSIRELEGHLKKIKMFSELQGGKQVTLDLVNKLFYDDFNKEHEGADEPLYSSKNWPRLKKEICRRFHIKAHELQSKSRLKHLVLARNLLIYLGRQELKLSLNELGSLLGNRNHSTILHSLKNIQKQKINQVKLAKDIQELTGFIHNTR